MYPILDVACPLETNKKGALHPPPKSQLDFLLTHLPHTLWKESGRSISACPFSQLAPPLYDTFSTEQYIKRGKNCALVFFLQHLNPCMLIGSLLSGNEGVASYTGLSIDLERKLVHLWWMPMSRESSRDAMGGRTGKGDRLIINSTTEYREQGGNVFCSKYFSAESFLVLLCLTVSLLILPLVLPVLPPPPLVVLVLPLGILVLLLILAFMPSDARKITSPCE